MRTIRVEVDFEVGEIVYINTDPEQNKYVVVGYSVRPGYILYDLYSHGYGEYSAFEYEVNREKSII